MSGMTNEGLRAPFIWYGGKRRVATDVWNILGDVKRYVEPFAGSLGVLLGRPEPYRGLEIVNDLDGYVVNAWRAMRADPEAVAIYSLEPITELDLTAKHLWLVNEGKSRLHAGLIRDPYWYDAQVAGWWLQGISCWIGTGFCSGNGPWSHAAMDAVVGDEEQSADGQGVNRQLPHLRTEGQGVNRQLPHLADRGVYRTFPEAHAIPNSLEMSNGVSRKLPAIPKSIEMSNGVSRKLHAIPNREGMSNGVNRHDNLHAYMEALSARLEKVVICNGDWSRTVSMSALGARTIDPVGVFLDPPYRDHGDEYATRSTGVEEMWQQIEEWTRSEDANSAKIRVVLCGYEGDFPMPDGWSEIAYTAKGTNTANRDRERFWLNAAATQNHARFLRSQHETMELF